MGVGASTISPLRRARICLTFSVTSARQAGTSALAAGSPGARAGRGNSIRRESEKDRVLLAVCRPHFVQRVRVLG